MPGHHFVSSILTRASALGVRRTTGSTICKEASLSQSPEHSTCTFGYVIVLICSKRQFPAQRLAQSRLHVPSQALATRRSLCHETSSTHFWRMYLVYSAPTLPIQVSQESCTSLDTIEAQIHGQHVAGLRTIKGLCKFHSWRCGDANLAQVPRLQSEPSDTCGRVPAWRHPY